MSKASDEMDRWTTWPEWAKDAVVVDTDVHLSFWDAVRVCCMRQLTVSSKTWTPVEIGRTQTVSRVHIPPWRHKRSLGLQITAEPTP